MAAPDRNGDHKGHFPYQSLPRQEPVLWLKTCSVAHRMKIERVIEAIK